MLTQNMKERIRIIMTSDSDQEVNLNLKLFTKKLYVTIIYPNRRYVIGK